MTEGRYLTAAICSNGHVATDAVESHDNPGKFCQHCGAAIITACSHCRAAMRGRLSAIAAVIVGIVGIVATLKHRLLPCGWQRGCLTELAWQRAGLQTLA
jgi:hypothetical protein